jgi:5-(carboxyamino)imidazole ribonucleotide synthase
LPALCVGCEVAQRRGYSGLVKQGSALPRVGMVGGGQLARMTYEAVSPLGLTLRVLADRADDSAGRIGADVEVGSPDELEALRRFAAGCDVVTFDHELVPPKCLTQLELDGHRLYPSAATMSLAQNKRRQHEELGAGGFPMPEFRVIETQDDLLDFGRTHGWPDRPVVAKAVRGGYDGRGVWVLNGETEARRVYGEATGRGLSLLAETWVPIERELAVLTVRRPGGETVVYPVVETVQVAGICRTVLTPAPISEALAKEAQALGRGIAEAIGSVGVLAVEMFVSRDDPAKPLLVNELAARPHNSGHFSIEGCVTSQFENHVRAVLDWPLGETRLVAPAVAMENVLGGPVGTDPDALLARALEETEAKVHLYGKEARPGRKLGHVTALGETLEQARRRAARAAAILMGEV